ncbi:hypothetical protein [Streptomyces sp. NPDC057545]|uniref:hypothetical protein n=1 Tax=Streptomyces sp. NPDC057545 TaxID=3346164 RepID=UPI00369CA6CC
MAQELQQESAERGGQEGVRAGLPASWLSAAVMGTMTRAAMSRSSRCSSGPVSSATAQAVSMSSACNAWM